MKNCEYDYLLVGAGLFNAIIANEATKDKKKCLVVEKRNHIGGNLYCESIEDINVHTYGAHIFHTNKAYIWEYMNQLCKFNNYINSPIARYKDEIYNLPFNMNTFYQLWSVITPEQACLKIDSQRMKKENPQNLEEQALALVGTDIYNKLIKGYTEKQWGRDAIELPPYIIKRVPLRFTFNNNYFHDPYQGIPTGGYNSVFEKCFKNADILLNTDYNSNRHIEEKAKTIIYTGMIDEYYDYCFGTLEYRSLRFEQKILDIPNYQGNAVVNYTEREIPYTRIIEHKHFEFGNQEKTVITHEYPQEWNKGREPYYPIHTEKNRLIYHRYRKKGALEKKLYFAGRLGSYEYSDMDETAAKALTLYNQINKKI
jgi:UDP-galactopyranose mutase